MSFEPKKIEDLDPAESLQDNDLMFASVLGADDTYVSKKVTLEDIANYVRNGMEPVEPGFGGYETYDLSPEAIAQDYVWNYEVGQNEEGYEKTARHDCMVKVSGIPPNWSGMNTNIHITLDDIQISPRMLFYNNRPFFVKKGQKFRLYNSNYPDQQWPALFINIIPIKSGGVFIDTTKPASAYVNEQLIPENTVITASYPSLIIGDIPHQNGKDKYEKESRAGSSTGIYQRKITLNGVDVLPSRIIRDTEGSFVNASDSIRELLVEAGDRIMLWNSSLPNTGNQDIANLDGKYCMYPLLMDSSSSESEPESVQLWENGPYWATKNIGAENIEDYGLYFDFGGLVGYTADTVNNRWIGDDGSTDHWFKPQYQTFPSSEEDRLVDNLISQDWIVDDTQTGSGYVLSPTHDVAFQRLGSNWRIPSEQDWTDLTNNCDITPLTYKGVYGVKVTGRNDYSLFSIFLPFSGYCQNDNHNNASAAHTGNRGAAIYHTSKCFQAGSSSGTVISQHKTWWIDFESWTELSYFHYGTPIRPIKVVS